VDVIPFLRLRRRKIAIRALTGRNKSSLLALNGLIGAAAYGSAVASAIADFEDDTDDDRR